MVADLREMQENQGFSENRIDKPEFVVLQPYQIILASSSFFIVFVFCNKRPAILLNGCCRGQILFITAKYNLFHSFFFAH